MGGWDRIQSNPDEKQGGKWNELFGNNNPIHIEIGCGKGQFVTQMAANNPNINYIAIDVVPDVLVIALEKATAAEVSGLPCPQRRKKALEKISSSPPVPPWVP